MNVKLLTLLVAIGLFTFGTNVNAAEGQLTAQQEANAQQISLKDIIDAIKGAINSPDGINKLCQKGSIWSAKISIRSLDGQFCSQPIVGAMAEVLCTPSNPDNYTGSKCHNNALQALGSQKPEEFLKKAIGDKGSAAFDFFCKGQNAFAPGGLLATIAGYCSKN